MKKLAGTGVAVALLMLALAACAAAANKEPSRAMDSDPRILDFAEVKTPSRPNAWLVAPPGTVDGVPFERGSGENLQLVIGNAGFIPGFEEGIKGAKKGDSRDVK
ncbi:MAG TPA: FKBP-type peptidyl-prolyl cis-trans isomerase, partial [Rhodospirillales bacterium]|nr:FKBP-type peptidyl-prolyl cis-trans isomerase [Rhodospirillales bacterium]